MDSSFSPRFYDAQYIKFTQYTVLNIPTECSQESNMEILKALFYFYLVLMMVFDYKEETKSPDTELLFIVPVLTQLTVVMQLTNVTQHNTAQCNTLLSETTQQTSYPNAIAITDIKNPKKASSFLRPEKEKKMKKKN